MPFRIRLSVTLRCFCVRDVTSRRRAVLAMILFHYVNPIAVFSSPPPRPPRPYLTSHREERRGERGVPPGGVLVIPVQLHTSAQDIQQNRTHLGYTTGSDLAPRLLDSLMRNRTTDHFSSCFSHFGSGSSFKRCPCRCCSTWIFPSFWAHPLREHPYPPLFLSLFLPLCWSLFRWRDNGEVYLDAV